MPRRLLNCVKGATAIEYGLLAALLALVLVVALPALTHELRSNLVRAREGMKGKPCSSDPLAGGTQCG
ncbi:Flp family type IVb pilin [Sphingomonas solaris]|uniref:Flp family type IVb pilin n=1 Tax=Alterirhizorhabdus solaris TaxID=2529389 RepID=A0A558R868_9SPHN|nr:Flp family type IVb pilin [Sphingomonas solaris]TVV75556.1 Flp family type IVb pilin [Sphingomonas solaris]